MAKVLEVQQLNKYFGQFQALKNVSFDIEKGEVFGFLGPNGSGKSTTIRAILGLIKHDSGDIKLLGMDTEQHMMAAHQRIAYVPDDVYLWPNLTGGEVIDLLLRMSGHEHTARTDALIKKFELNTKKKSRTYSTGNRQKVPLIVAFSLDVDLYIFDEPTSGLDPLQARNFQEEVLALKQAGKTVLLSSHILSEVEKMIDKLAIIRNGEIIESGTLSSMQNLAELNVKATLPDYETVLRFSHRHKFASIHNTASFAIRRDELATVLRELSEADVQDLQITPPTLEDLFIQYYDVGGAQ